MRLRGGCFLRLFRCRRFRGFLHRQLCGRRFLGCCLGRDRFLGFLRFVILPQALAVVDLCEEQPLTSYSISTTRKNTASWKNPPATVSPSTWITFWTRLHSAQPNSKSAKKESSSSNRFKLFPHADKPNRLFGGSGRHAPCHAVRRSPFRSTPRTCLSACCG